MGIIYKNGTYYGGGSGGGGAEVTIDNELSSTSENPVQNKVIKAELDNKQDADDLMTSADMDDVVTPLPGVASRLPRYSTEEQIVGYWIDGKPIYQKTISYSITSPTDSWKISPHNIQNLEMVIHGFGLIKTYDGNNWVISGYRESQAFSQLLINETNIMVYTPANNIYNNANVYVTVQYTKTTD